MTLEELPDQDYPLYMAASKPLFTRSEKINLTTFGICVLFIFGMLSELSLAGIVNLVVVTGAFAPIVVAVAYMLYNGVRGRMELNPMETIYAVIGMVAGLVISAFVVCRYADQIDQAGAWFYRLARKGKKN